MNAKARNRPAISDDGGVKRFEAPKPNRESDLGARPVPQRKQTPADLQLEVASYIEVLSAELRALAKTAGLGSLAYFLEMARLEASIQVERHAASTTERREATRDGCRMNH